MHGGARRGSGPVPRPSVVRMQRSRNADQHLRKVGEDTPVVSFVGVGQRGARYAATKAKMVELAAQRTQTRFDIAQTVAISKLRKRHRQILIPTGEAAQPRISAVARHAPSELAVRKEADQLGENGSAFIHLPLLPLGSGPEFWHAQFKSRQDQIANNSRRWKNLPAEANSLAGQ